ncbi:MAG: rhodanese-like domain-containing protein [Pseudomonadota bacterium]
MMNVKQINVQTAKEWLDNDEAILIDVREPAEHAFQKIAGSILHPVGTISPNLIENTDKKILVYCQKGIRSFNACLILLSGSPKLSIYNIAGGIEEWQQSGLPVENGL